MPKRILVADDDQNFIKLYTRIFTGKEYALTPASSFTEASRLIKANHYDLLVTDLMFPDGLGTDLIKLFENKRTGAKSLLVTGTPDMEETLKSTGTTEYFPKPFNLQYFMIAVAKALNN
mgnify:CR=1 FL=1